ncbi:replication-associated protein RepA1 (plasmid) [Buchnera aphidicola (Nipponaphis monzeni)]|uniref:Replication-associated protein RepA1 n=1 Tax=Buchnera aphidicola (Nipponaphis monzeni) TaxID=2495405 RepID=A0A455TAT4_9GAMM|nr:plasmid replication initiator RepA [Buchnera aphidicola]BBI01451.1 replication-associated protein RepA1 [Buchnera aphidicola (Nipponaphis monzeni)]
MLYKKKYVYNMFPIFTPPKEQKPRPAFIKYAMSRASMVDVARSELNYTLQPKSSTTGKKILRKRRLNEHRACAMRAMVSAMLYHFNIVSELVQATVEQLSDECGLSTISKAGNKSITRASRLITDFMEPMGFVTCKKIWDKIVGTYLPKIIRLTPLFFNLFGISVKRLHNAQLQRLGWINKGLIDRGLECITLVEACRRIKDNQICNIFKYRKSKHSFYKQKIKAQKICRLEETEAKQKILRVLVKRYSLVELTTMGPQGLKKQVNIEYYYLRKLAITPYPDADTPFKKTN